MRVVVKHVQSVHWKEAARILKSILDQWNRVGVTAGEVSNFYRHSELTLTMQLLPNQRKPDFELSAERPAYDAPQSPKKLHAQLSVGGGNGDSLRRVASGSQVSRQQDCKWEIELCRVEFANVSSAFSPRRASKSVCHAVHR